MGPPQRGVVDDALNSRDEGMQAPEAARGHRSRLLARGPHAAWLDEVQVPLSVSSPLPMAPRGGVEPNRPWRPARVSVLRGAEAGPAYVLRVGSEASVKSFAGHYQPKWL